MQRLKDYLGRFPDRYKELMYYAVWAIVFGLTIQRGLVPGNLAKDVKRKYFAADT